MTNEIFRFSDQKFRVMTNGIVEDPPKGGANISTDCTFKAGFNDTNSTIDIVRFERFFHPRVFSKGVHTPAQHEILLIFNLSQAIVSQVSLTKPVPDLHS
uniref:Uncharacterized protein n=1 Tax=Romanomermis culicivorax TaxID=13658 RepID=A0A915HV02_ROMCU